jgi:hypothetical protein
MMALLSSTDQNSVYVSVASWISWNKLAMSLEPGVSLGCYGSHNTYSLALVK